MWYLINNQISNEFKEKLITSYFNFDRDSEQRHFNIKGKHFFDSIRGITFVKTLVESLKNVLFEYFEEPVIDHMYILSKSHGGNETPLTKIIGFG